jgi:hypothetical protein
MSRCPFWSTTRENADCYDECPILIGESSDKDGEKCIFHECTESINTNFKDIIKEDYNFLDLSIYDDESSNKININY